jgi:2'-5' RNA ligase
MTLYVVLLFDEAGDQTVRIIWQALADQHVSDSAIKLNVPPHLTLGIIRYEDQQNFLPKLKAYADNLHQIPINMPHIGLFTSQNTVIFLGVTVTDALYNLHRQLYQTCVDFVEKDSLYTPEFWIPHVTLAVDLQTEKFPSALEVCQQFTLPITINANAIALVKSDNNEILAKYTIR